MRLSARSRTWSPIIAATLQAVILSAIANVIAQFIEAYRIRRIAIGEENALELFRFVVLTFITTPPNYKWQQFLERSFPAYTTGVKIRKDDDVEKRIEAPVSGPKGKLNMRNTFTKWFIDCITLGAIFNTIAFLLLMGVLKGNNWVEISLNLRAETIPIIVAGYKVWPIASMVSFGLIPVEKRILFLSFIGLCWGVYMSLVAERV